MSRWRRKTHRDVGEPSIVLALHGVGATTYALPGGEGEPDLLVGFRGVNYLLEVKDAIGPKGGTSRHGQQLSDEQLKWHRTWKGQSTVVRSAREALVAIGAIAA